MKLAIYTQYQENYGDAEKPHWKFKGGATFVVENLTPAQCRTAIESGCPTLRGLIETSGHGSCEYVVDINVLDDADAVGEPWATVTKLSYENGRWIACEVEENGEYGYMRREILRRRAAWVMLSGGERAEYKCEYELHDGKMVSFDKLAEALGLAANA